VLTALLVCTLAKNVPRQSFDRVIGVDRGALLCANQGIMMDVAIGDFDSVTDEEFQLIKQFCQEIIILPHQKDEGDTEAALKLVAQANYIIIVGALGKRLDHQWVIFQLLRKYPQAQCIDDNNRILITQKTIEIMKDDYPYLSCFALEDSQISMKNVRYPLSHYILSTNNLIGLSNEIVGDKTTLWVHYGEILVIQSKD